MTEQEKIDFLIHQAELRNIVKVFVEHSIYHIELSGWVHYEGDNKWKVDTIIFSPNNISNIVCGRIYLK